MTAGLTFFTSNLNATQSINISEPLSAKEKSIVTISALTAKGDLVSLKTALTTGLEARLTINEIKEVLVHLYAYCGFPRSIRGLQTFIEVLDNRKSKGINDTVGADASPIKNEGSKYERGKKVLDDLTKAQQGGAPSGYAAFAPIIDTLLKEHLFSDVFERDVLNYMQRELVTISVISAIGDADPMLKSHLAISLNAGLSPEQLKEFIQVIAPAIGKKKTMAAKNVLDELLETRKTN